MDTQEAPFPCQGCGHIKGSHTCRMLCGLSEIGTLRRELAEARRERDEARAEVALLRQALKDYYHECRCQRTEMDEINRRAYAALRATDGPEDKP